MFVLILNPKVCFGQIWSRKLQFSKLTKICYRGSLLYPFFEFNIEFSHSYFFLASFVQNLKFSKLTEIRYRGTLLYAYYDFNIYFPKILLKKFLETFWANLPPNLKFFKLTEISFRVTLLYTYYNLNVYYFKCCLISSYCLLFYYKQMFIVVIHTILGKFGLKI